MEIPNQKNVTEKQLNLTADIFPVIWEFNLRSFEVDSHSSVVRNQLLNQLAYHLGQHCNSTWANCQGDLITDHVGDLPEDILTNLWNDERSRFRDVIAIRENLEWDSQPAHVAEMANSKFKQLRKHLNNKLEKKKFGDAIVHRQCYSQAMVIEGRPCLALSLSSKINYQLNLAELMIKRPTLNILGLEVNNRANGWLAGTIVEITGHLDSENRKRLLGMSTTEKQQNWISTSPDETVVVRIRTRSGIYLEYVSSGLIPVPTYGALKVFGLDQNQISNYQRISSESRREILLDLISSSRLHRLLGPPIDSSENACFMTAADLGYDGKILVGNGNTAHISQNIRALKNHGFYRIHEKFEKNRIVRLGVLNGVKEEDLDNFLSNLKREFDQFGFSVEITGLIECDARDFAELEKSLETLMRDSHDIVLTILPSRFFSAQDHVEGPYQDTKHLTINRGTMNQAVSVSTVRNFRYKLANLTIGMLAKLGNIPWVLPRELEFCDRILGADISRKAKQNQKGTRNELGIPRWYKSNGDLLNYRLTKSKVDGETIPLQVIREITPRESFSNTRILFHGDGKRPQREIDNFQSRAEELDGEIIVVQVIKKCPARLYSSVNGISNPKKGDSLVISETEAIVISTLAQHNTGTPHPLLIRCTPNITIENAILSVLKLSDLHYGSQQQPRCPITTHDAHHISNMLMMGIRPPDEEGTVPWWL